jgi:hypothetical protein
MKCEEATQRILEGGHGTLSRWRVAMHVRNCEPCGSVRHAAGNLERQIEMMEQPNFIDSQRRIIAQRIGLDPQTSAPKSIQENRRMLTQLYLPTALVVAAIGVFSAMSTQPRASEIDKVTQAMNKAKSAHVQFIGTTKGKSVLKGEVWYADGTFQISKPGAPKVKIANGVAWQYNAKTKQWKMNGKATASTLSDVLPMLFTREDEEETLFSPVEDGETVIYDQVVDGDIELEIWEEVPATTEIITAMTRVKNLQKEYTKQITDSGAGVSPRPAAGTTTDSGPAFKGTANGKTYTGQGVVVNARVYADKKTKLPEKMVWYTKSKKGEVIDIGTMKMTFNKPAPKH